MVQFFDPTQEVEIKRRRRMAEALQRQGTPKQTEVIGGYAVPQSGLEHLVRGLSGGIGAYQEATADAKEQDLVRQRQELMAKAIEKMGTSPKDAAGLLMQDPSMMKEGLSLYSDTIANENKLASELAKMKYETEQKDKEFSREADLKRELVKMRQGGKESVDPDTGEIVYTAPAPEAKPLPVGALKMQDDALEALGSADAVAAETARLSNLVKTGALELGPVTNTTSRLRNFLGASSPTSQAYADMTTSLETIRNNTLLLHKGVQTEGDAIRAMNQVTATRNDPVAFAQAMDKLNAINQRAAALQKNRINSVRKNYGASEYDFGGMSGVSGATPARNNAIDAADPRIAKAKAAGYSDEEIQQYLKGR